MMRKFFAATLVFVAFYGSPSYGQSGVYGTYDPNSYARPYGQAPVVSYDHTWQTDPFSVGYTLTGGYRSLYSGAPQPVGHETIMTHGGNGYIYRPVYGEQPFYGPQHFGSYGVVTTGNRPLFHGSRGSALVIDNPGTPYESRYTPSSGSPGHAALIDVMPHQYYSNPYGPGAEYAAAYYDPGYIADGVPAAYVGPSVDAAPPAVVEELPEQEKAVESGKPAQKPAAKKMPKAGAEKAAPKPVPKKLESNSSPSKMPAKPKASEF